MFISDINKELLGYLSCVTDQQTDKYRKKMTCFC